MTRFSKTPPKEHTDKGGDKGPSSAETDIEGDKGPSSVRKDKLDPATGIESAKGSSPADFASSVIYAGTSKGGNLNWGDLEEDMLEKDNEDPSEKSEDGNTSSHISSLRSIHITTTKMRGQMTKRTQTFHMLV